MKYNEITGKNAKDLILFGGFFITLFIGFIMYSIFSNNEKVSLKYEDEVYMRVNKIRDYKGFITLNDSLIISNNIKAIATPEYIKEEFLIKYISKPYLIKKEKNTYEFDVIDNQFNYTFRLFEDKGF
ncbi:hypothetical protein [Lacinutrix chionoecetis]